MKRPAQRRLLALLVIGALCGGVAAVAACSNQGEGEVCQIANGDDDCQTDLGYACYDHKQLNNTTSDRCCPADRSKAVHPACVTPIAIVTDDAQAPSNTGPTPTNTSDAQVATDANTADVHVSDAADQ